MADKEQLALLKQGVLTWNAWRQVNPHVRPNLSGAYLAGTNLFQADLHETSLSQAVLAGAYLGRANLAGAYLGRANLMGANLAGQPSPG